MKKLSLATVVLPTIILCILSTYLYLEKISDNNLLLEHKTQIQRLLSQLKSASEKEIAQEEELAMLRDEIARLNIELAANFQPTSITEESPLPDYQETEEEVRQRIIYEYELNKANKNFDSRLDLIQEISSLEPSSVNEIMSLQRQFGPFIQALNVQEERLEEIVGVLTNYVAGQSQARQMILQQAQSDQIERREIGNLMRTVMDQELMYQELSYYLTQDEILLLQQTHEEQASDRPFDSRSRPPSRFRDF